MISENFKMKSIYTGNNGNTIWEDVTPLKGEIAAIEQKMYVDVQTNSAVLVEHKEDGKGIKRMSIVSSFLRYNFTFAINQPKACNLEINFTLFALI